MLALGSSHRSHVRRHMSPAQSRKVASSRLIRMCSARTEGARNRSATSRHRSPPARSWMARWTITSRRMRRICTSRALPILRSAARSDNPHRRYNSRTCQGGQRSLASIDSINSPVCPKGLALTSSFRRAVPSETTNILAAAFRARVSNNRSASRLVAKKTSSAPSRARSDSRRCVPAAGRARRYNDALGRAWRNSRTNAVVAMSPTSIRIRGRSSAGPCPPPGSEWRDLPGRAHQLVIHRRPQLLEPRVDCDQ